MIKKIRGWFQARMVAELERREKLLKLKAENFDLKTEINKLKIIKQALDLELSLEKRIVKETEKKIGNPIYVVRALTNDNFSWFNYKELSDNDQSHYHGSAQNVLKSKVFQNEVAALNAEFINQAAKMSPNFEDVLAMRHQVSGINLLVERLSEIVDPTTVDKPAEEPYKGV